MFGLPDGQRQIIIQGRQRFEIAEFLETDPVLIARVTMVEEKVPQSKQFEARILNLRQEAVKALSLLPEPMNELRSTVERIEDPLALIDMIASTLDLPLAEKQEILATLDPETRAQKVSEKLARQIELLELSKKIGDQTKESMDRTQRQYFLREQMKAIQKELGEADGTGWKLRSCARKSTMPRCLPRWKRKCSESCRGSSAFLRWPRSIRRYGLISIGWWSFPGAFPARSRSIFRKRVKFSTPIITI